ncbi:MULTISPECIES: pyrroline-5-carboxylate reductase [Thioclava]|uniref:Pyrroline-5-carboxylate reductase n=1 Tax=Thioclava electrotropha TaxID=1549850 RepID=A0ABX6Z058_9RHOB|nr:pyrroline-5-carboxylate reductase [Thioclava electrotropha]MPQ96129.1 pyrroline-5-carboxylate reductase [Thioclava sp. JE_KL1]QPZ93428.1 pyrroline-5-carboxylate reductase [Thioclava electrotropha]
MRLLFIGCGNMGAAIAAGALRKRPATKITVVDRNPERARGLLPASGAEFYGALQDVTDETFDATILAIKPQQFHALPGSSLPKNCGTLISIMAGVTLDRMQVKLGTDRAVRTMPNLPALVARGMTVGVAGKAVSEADKALVSDIFEGSGRFEWLESEDQIDSVTAVAGSGPGYIFAFAHYITEAARAEGLPGDLADTLVRQTLLGAAELLHSDARSALELKRAVTSKAGTTEAGLAVFEAEVGLSALCRRGVAAARARAEELARED